MLEELWVLEFFLFAIAAVMLVILAMILSTLADMIDRESEIKAIFISLLLGGASALPELTTSFTSVMIDNPDLAAGNVFGSNAFNISILALMDLIFIRHKMFNYTSKDHSYNILLIMTLSLYLALVIFLQLPYTIFGIGLDTIILVILYFTGIRLISRFSQKDMTGPAEVENEIVNQIGKERTFIEKISLFFHKLSVGQAYSLFFLCTIFVTFFGAILTITADDIAVITGLGATFIGSTLLALGTSLPETTSIINSLRLKNYNLAVGAILGSTPFNFFNIAITAVIYRKGTLFSSIDQSHIFTLLTCIILYSLTFYAIRRNRVERTSVYITPSLLTIIFYLFLSYLLFAL